MDAKSLIEIMREADLIPYEYRREEGHGQMCLAVNTGDAVNCVLDIVGVLVDNSTDGGVDVAEYQEELNELLTLIRSPRQKEVGSEIVLYWPKIEWPS